ncbi:MAG: hypothetical protein COX65_03155 [Elusimicrobia bacterium CG_4_10_14_0_2_um_filter_56_8]|nr:MAG: hypothetical protein AUJ51_02470 [Elusimicrobia bacterium CG1_02_56_21]PJA16194.1 MAG: hypothetical protein COX65_03155 [Elusimicrobia bacterium CG_4_10_14_0_2_um_filter_56_8]
MKDNDLFWSIVKYSLLYALGLVPLGLFLGVVTCTGVFFGADRANNDFGTVAGITGFAIVFGGSLYISYKLGREKAEGKAKAGTQEINKDQNSGGSPAPRA